MKAQEIPDLKEKVLGLLPITQADMWKNLGINRRDASKLVSIMINEGLIERTRINGTYLLEEKKKRKKGFAVLLSESGKFSPCCGCELDCEAEICTKLRQWLID